MQILFLKLGWILKNGCLSLSMVHEMINSNSLIFPKTFLKKKFQLQKSMQAREMFIRMEIRTTGLILKMQKLWLRKFITL